MLLACGGAYTTGKVKFATADNLGIAKVKIRQRTAHHRSVHAASCNLPDGTQVRRVDRSVHLQLGDSFIKRVFDERRQLARFTDIDRIFDQLASYALKADDHILSFRELKGTGVQETDVIKSIGRTFPSPVDPHLAGGIISAKDKGMTAVTAIHARIEDGTAFVQFVEDDVHPSFLFVTAAPKHLHCLGIAQVAFHRHSPCKYPIRR